jgi:hypothetical protein
MGECDYQSNTRRVSSPAPMDQARPKFVLQRASNSDHQSWPDLLRCISQSGTKPRWRAKAKHWRIVASHPQKRRIIYIGHFALRAPLQTPKPVFLSVAAGLFATNYRNRSGVAWFWVGFFFSPFVAFVLLLVTLPQGGRIIVTN